MNELTIGLNRNPYKKGCCNWNITGAPYISKELLFSERALTWGNYKNRQIYAYVTCEQLRVKHAKRGGNISFLPADVQMAQL